MGLACWGIPVPILQVQSFLALGPGKPMTRSHLVPFDGWW